VLRLRFKQRTSQTQVRRTIDCANLLRPIAYSLKIKLLMHENCYKEYININMYRSTGSANSYITEKHFNNERFDASGLSSSRRGTTRTDSVDLTKEGAQYY
jgi:hypothetical protein